MCSLLEQFEEASQSIDSDLAFDLDFPKRYEFEFTDIKVFYFFSAHKMLHSNTFLNPILRFFK